MAIVVVVITATIAAPKKSQYTYTVSIYVESEIYSWGRLERSRTVCRVISPGEGTPESDRTAFGQMGHCRIIEFKVFIICA